ncbi:hypothetical protein AA313_de0206395 [Arthrobotrys entomopaga]|nr:hypothetical protein AA313_de0206395 [Arthrobotrys entomopaga]
MKLVILSCNLMLAVALPAARNEVAVECVGSVTLSASPTLKSIETSTTSSAWFTSTPHDLDGFVPLNPDAVPDTPKNGYNFTGNLTKPETAPYQPQGGLGTDPRHPPVYNPLSDFDAFSLSLALNQEWIELDLFHNGLARFSVKDFEDAGLTAEDRYLIEFMANQEIGHAQIITNILGPRAPKQCTYVYPSQTVHEFIDFCQKLTRFGESGVYGFLEHLNSRPAAQLLLQSITTEARQQLIFRQFEGLFPMPVWFEVGITQSMAWTLLAPYIHECPAENPHLPWQNFPALLIENNPNATDPRFGPKISTNRTALSYPGRIVELSWEEPGKVVGYNKSYVTSTTAGAPKWVAWLNQVNLTYTALENVTENRGYTKQPNVTVFADQELVNGTMFIMITDDNPYITPANLSILNQHVVAGPALYQSG